MTLDGTVQSPGNRGLDADGIRAASVRSPQARLSQNRRWRVLAASTVLPLWIAAIGAMAAGVSAAEAEDRDEKAAAAKDRPAEIDARKQELYERAVAAARVAMSRRDAAGGTRNAEAAAKLAQSPREEAESARLEALAQHLEEFWKLMGKVIAGLTPAQEFTLNNTPIIVVESSATEIVFRIEGRNRTYPVKALPRDIVVAMVQGGFADDAVTKLLLGTYHAMDAQGDRQAARRLWQEVIDGGNNDVRDLMAELSVAPAAKTLPQPAAPKRPEKTQSGRTEAPTDAAALRKAEQAVRAQFEVDYNLASSPSGKLKLAEKLSEAAVGADVPAENRFVMLRDARDYALAAGKPGAACDTIDLLAQHFNVDALEMKTEAIERAARTLRTSSGSKETAELALTLLEEAAPARRWGEAARLAAVAVSAAQRARNAGLLQSAREAKRKVEQAEKGAERREKTRPK